MAFMRLDRPSLAILSRRTESQLMVSRLFNLLFGEEPLEIPRVFATITEARIYLQDVSWRITSISQPPESLIEIKEEGIFNEELLPFHLKQWYEASGLLENSSHLSLEIVHWHDAFSPTLTYAMCSLREDLFVSAVTLHIQALSADLIASGRFSGSGSPYPLEEDEDRFSTVHAIINLSRRLVLHPDFRKGFVFDIGIIPSLFTIWLLCPVQYLKEESIEVLESMKPRREVFWDSRTATRAGRTYLEQQQNLERPLK